MDCTILNTMATCIAAASIGMAAPACANNGKTVRTFTGNGTTHARAICAQAHATYLLPRGGPHGAALAVLVVLYVTSWALLGKSMGDAGLALQTGSLGWIALLRRQRPVYPALPQTGQFTSLSTSRSL